EARDPAYWARQMTAPVRFAAAVSAAAEEPDVDFIEAGPGQALVTLARLNLGPSRRVLASLGHAREGREDDDVFLNSLGQAFVSGAAIDWSALRAREGRPRRVSLSGYAFEPHRYWVDAPRSGRAPATQAIEPEAAALP